MVVGGISVGGLATTDAASAIRQAFATPVELTYRGTTISIAPDLLGATAAIDRALAKAQTAPPDAVVQLQVRVDRARIAAFLGNVAKRFDRSSVDARLLLRDLHPVITPARRGVTVDIRRATAAIATALTS
ncbi:MAG TPA: peptidoglycan binding domain-containing protein, partial [Candidatus Binatia bacterium]|nr:peptidoglycan binding domain-containing protein [Candidatus Binatia bacterium]